MHTDQGTCHPLHVLARTPRRAACRPATRAVASLLSWCEKTTDTGQTGQTDDILSNATHAPTFLSCGRWVVSVLMCGCRSLSWRVIVCMQQVRQRPRVVVDSACVSARATQNVQATHTRSSTSSPNSPQHTHLHCHLHLATSMYLRT
jgi:hypothetical protein